MPNFSMREQLLIALIFLLIILLVGACGIHKLNIQEKNLLIQIEKQELQIKRIRSLSSEWNKIQSKPNSPVMLQDLSSFVENIARSLEIQDNLQLNVLSN
ncbi:MAG: hypothetical protein VX485_05500, partial [SAR324 cluster bacterium]|nr:hypothetical protein [SAR324 cluster bacterium]